MLTSTNNIAMQDKVDTLQTHLLIIIIIIIIIIITTERID